MSLLSNCDSSHKHNQTCYRFHKCRCVECKKVMADARYVFSLNMSDEQRVIKAECNAAWRKGISVSEYRGGVK